MNRHRLPFGRRESLVDHVGQNEFVAGRGVGIDGVKLAGSVKLDVRPGRLVELDQITDRATHLQQDSATGRIYSQVFSLPLIDSHGSKSEASLVCTPLRISLEAVR